MVTENNIGIHQGMVNNILSFNDAYQMLLNNPVRQFETTGSNTSFDAVATAAQKGAHIGERVIVFRSNDSEMARAYECCWGYKTNCYGTYLDCYTEAISD